MDAVGEEKLKEAFVRVADQVFTDRDIFIKCMTEDAEQVYLEEAIAVDVTAIDMKLGKLRRKCSR